MSEMWYTYWLACVEGITGDRKCELCRKNGSAEAVYYIEEKGIRELEGSVSKSGGSGNSDGSPGTEQLSETV